MVSRPRILVVDDDLNVLRMLALTLFVEGFSVATASSGTEAERLMQEEVFDILILDLRMPCVDCFGIINLFKERCGSGPIVVTTKYLDEHSKSQCDHVGAQLIEKPYNVHVLASELRKSLALSA